MLARASELMPHAGVATKVLSALRGDASANVIRQEISFDQGLTSVVLRASNSTLYMRAGGCAKDLTEAIVVLGYDTLRDLVLARLASGMVRQHDKMEQMVWRHSLASALAAQSCARIAGKITVSHAFTCGILHDVGQGTLLATFGKQYAAILEHGGLHGSNIQDLERAELGTDHGEVGAHLLHAWKMPTSYSAVAMHHHLPARATGVTDKDKRLLYIVSLSSDVATAALRAGAAAGTSLGLESHPLLAPLGLQPQAPDMMASHVHQQLSSLEGIFTDSQAAA